MLTRFNNYNPVELIQKPLNLLNIKGYLPESGYVLLLCSKRMAKTETIKNILDFKKESFILCDKILPNPDLDLLDYLTSDLRNKNIKLIVCIGGGSIIDAGKSLSLSLCIDRENIFSQYFRQNLKVNWDNKIPCMAIPTTSGTGSEFTQFATIWSKSEQKKYSLEHSLVYPNYSLLDPSLTMTLSYDETLFGALDCLSHSLESIWNKNANSISRQYSMNALQLIKSNIRELLDDLSNKNLRANMQYASSYAGMAISQTKTAIAHSISYPITATYGVPHGLACSFTLKTILEDNIEMISENPDEYDLLDEILQILNSLELESKIKEYLSFSELMGLSGSMINKERAGNFLFQFDLNQILLRSLDQ